VSLFALASQRSRLNNNERSFFTLFSSATIFQGFFVLGSKGMFFLFESRDSIYSFKRSFKRMLQCKYFGINK